MGDEARDDQDHDWVLLSTYDDPALARMTLDFLRVHDIPVQTRGDSPEGVRNYVPLDIRFVVPSARLEEAREALAAFTTEPAEATPFRGPLPPPELASANDDDEASTAALRKKSGPFAFALALLVPFGGGHFYAHHNAAGVVLGVGVLLTLVGAGQARSIELARAAGIIIVVDAVVASFFAVRRHNQGLIPSATVQCVTALVIVVWAVVAGFAWPF